MRQQRQSQRVAVSETVAPDRVSDSPLYGVAMLKIAMELKKPDAGELEEILTGVLARMKLSEDDFRDFLAKNGGLLRAIATKRKY